MITVVILLGFSVFANAPVCSCLLPTPDTLLMQSDAVFLGVVVDVSVEREEYEHPTAGRTEYPVEHTARFRLIQSWKEPQAQGMSILSRLRQWLYELVGWKHTIIVHTGGGGGDCGIAFEEGEVYLVFARELKGMGLWTLTCDGTVPHPTEDSSWARLLGADSRYYMAVLGPPLADYRLAGDPPGYSPTDLYGADVKLAILDHAAMDVLGWETRIERPDSLGRYGIFYSPPWDDEWLRVGSIDRAWLDEDMWDSIHAELQRMREPIHLRWPDYAYE